MTAADEMTDDQKLRQMAKASSFYRASVAEMVEAGYDPDELDTAVEEMEEALEQERTDKQRRLAKRRAVRTF